MGGMTHPSDPLRQADAEANNWHGKCFMFDDEMRELFALQLTAASAPTRIVTYASQREHVIEPDPEDMEYWLLVGSPVRVPLEKHWSAIYQLEPECLGPEEE